MKLFKQEYITKYFMAIFCTAFFNAETMGAADHKDDAGLELKEVKTTVNGRDYAPHEEDFGHEMRDATFTAIRRAGPSFAGGYCLSSVAISGLKVLSEEAVKGVTIASGCVGFLGAAALNSYNWWKDRDSVKTVSDNVLNGLIISTNVASGALAFASVRYYDEDPVLSNACGVASGVIGASGLFLQGVKLLLTTTPQDDYRCKVACKLAQRGNEPAV